LGPKEMLTGYALFHGVSNHNLRIRKELQIRGKYDNPEIYVSEIGFSGKEEQKMTRTEARHDADRVNYIRTYPAAMQEVMRDGYNVKGFMAWSILKLSVDGQLGMGYWVHAAIRRHAV
jgi:beta-glucosidase/6-phospho-beta-glucosidase/beta-galactosidase